MWEELSADPSIDGGVQLATHNGQVCAVFAFGRRIDPDYRRQSPTVVHKAQMHTR